MRETRHDVRFGGSWLHRHLHRVLTGLVLTALALAPAAAPANASYGSQGGYDVPHYGEASYSFVRILEGTATLFPAGTDQRQELEVNYPLLAGDRIWTSPGSCVEIVLSDGNVLRLDGDSELIFDRLADSPDRDDAFTLLRLPEGNAQLIVSRYADGTELPRIDTANAAVYIEEAGSYRITSLRHGWTQVVVRRGHAEVVSQDGSFFARRGEQLEVEGAYGSYKDLRPAGREDSLERWGERLELASRHDDYDRYDDLAPEVRYAAGSLHGHGEWIYVHGNRAWRPYTTGDWRPYWKGRWVSTPLGLNWVSSEPWGWVPYHYGTWDRVAGHGWVWFPGRRFAPAHVYWYWGDGYSAWYPTGRYVRYYDNHYDRGSFGWSIGFRNAGFHFGLFGSAGGSWDLFLDWNWCSTAYLGHRYQYRHVTYGHHVREVTHWRTVPHGVVTYDTRHVTADVWHDTDRVHRVLREQTHAYRYADKPANRNATRNGDLVDMTPILERQAQLPENVERQLRQTRGAERTPATRSTSSDRRTATARTESRDTTTRDTTRGTATRGTATRRDTDVRRETETRGTTTRSTTSRREVVRRTDDGVDLRSNVRRDAQTRRDTDVRRDTSTTRRDTSPRRDTTTSRRETTTRREETTPPRRSNVRRDTSTRRDSGTTRRDTTTSRRETTTRRQETTPPRRSNVRRDTNSRSDTSTRRDTNTSRRDTSTRRQESTPPPRSNARRDTSTRRNTTSGRQNTRSQGTRSQSTRSQGTRSQSTRSQSTRSQGTRSQSTRSRGTRSQGTRSQGTRSQGTRSQGTRSQGTRTQSTRSQSTRGSSARSDSGSSRRQSSASSQSRSSNRNGSTARAQGRDSNRASSSARGSNNQQRNNNRGRASSRRGQDREEDG